MPSAAKGSTSAGTAAPPRAVRRPPTVSCRPPAAASLRLAHPAGPSRDRDGPAGCASRSDAAAGGRHDTVGGRRTARGGAAVPALVDPFAALGMLTHGLDLKTEC